MSAPFLDTQVLSYSFGGKYSQPITDSFVSSIAASEFLLQQAKSNNHANYYIPPRLLTNPYNYHYYSRATRSSKKMTNLMNKYYTDKIIMEFGSDFNPIVEYSSRALAHVINTGRINVFCDAISVVEKKKRKVIEQRFNFILDNRIVCKPLCLQIVQQGYELLYSFLDRHNLKANFRNSWNDILIFATSLYSHVPLITYDNELSKFMTESFADSSSRVEGKFSEVRFAPSADTVKHIRRESKGYINRGWRVIFKSIR